MLELHCLGSKKGWETSALNANSDTRDSTDPYNTMTMALYLYDGLSPNLQAQSNHEENIRQAPVEGHPTTDLASPPWHHHSEQTQGRSETLSQPRGV